MNPEAQARLDLITAKEPHELVPEEIRFIKARREYLSKKSESKFASVLKAKTPVEEEVTPHGVLSGKELVNKAKGLGLQTKGLPRPEIERAVDTIEGPAGAVEPE